MLPVGEEVKKRRLTRRKSVAGGRGLAQPRKETEAEVHGDTVDPAGFKKKPAALQEHHAADGHIHQTVPEDRTGHDVVKSMANAATLTRYLKQLDGMRMDTECDHASFCSVDRAHQSEQARITLSVDRSSVRDPVVSALQQLGAARKYGRARRPSCLANSNSGWTPYSTSWK